MPVEELYFYGPCQAINGLINADFYRKKYLVREKVGETDLSGDLKI